MALLLANTMIHRSNWLLTTEHLIYNVMSGPSPNGPPNPYLTNRIHRQPSAGVTLVTLVTLTATTLQAPATTATTFQALATTATTFQAPATSATDATLR